MSKLHSKSMESIFGVQKIAGENFTSFMRPLIIPRDLEALEMFMRHLFNADMDEEVVNQLNPIEQVKIYHEDQGIVGTKFIRVMFTRIWKKDQIKNIMVTVSDETESILLQQHLEESEKKKKQETEQVLSILKIDPSLIRGFLYNAKRTLRGISERYEANKKKNLVELIDFTFQTIHNLKGNAVVIGLDLMSNKFHEIEDAVEKIRGKQITGKDFLTILYEMDEADKMIDDMSAMLRKVADIYRKYPSGGHVVSNIILINTLEKAVKVMSNKVEKPVDFFFNNEANLVIPDDYINSFKDIMIQLIRNSIAHGIEERNVRMNSGKLIGGTITVELDQPDGGELLQITYSDDGRGLDIKKITENAVTRNLITEYEANNLTRERAAEFIYETGFSTSKEIDKQSGRGQGMSLVSTLISDLNGSFKVDFEEGKFFKIIINIPLIPQQITENKADEIANS
jgi:chemotaxis protein histidine kinase CheA